jgi:hypothetical protein
MIRTSLLLAAFVTLTPVAVLAADSTPPPAPKGESGWLKRLDANQDGVITKDEAAKMPRIAKSFDRLDADRDGMITQDEMRAAGEARREEAKAELAARFKAADKNSDGLLSKDEATAGMPRVARRFDKLDTSKDGQVSPEELAAARQHFSDANRPRKATPGDSTQR